MNVVSRRVDALTLAYRVELSARTLTALEGRAELAKKHGRARLRVGKLAGEMKYTRGAKGVWNVRGSRYRVRIDLKATGGVDRRRSGAGEAACDGTREAGWTLEVIWSAQALAELPDVGAAVDETRELAKSLGTLLEARVRRFDLAADVAGWALEPEDTGKIVRRSRAKMTIHKRRAELRGTTIHESRGISGVTVCPGGTLMARIYDKRAELSDIDGAAVKVEGEETRTEAEERRWSAGGWNGLDPVTRVEFQVRGDAVKEFGARDPDIAYDPATGQAFDGGLVEVIDRIWQRCLSWVRLVVRDNERSSRCSDDPRWALLRQVTFAVDKPPAAQGRVRLRSGATVEQGLGCVLSILGSRELLPDKDEEAAPPASEAEVARVEREVRESVRDLFESAASVAAAHMLARWGPARAKQRLAVVSNSVRERFVA